MPTSNGGFYIFTGAAPAGGIYEADFGPVPGGWQITSAVVEGDRSSYRRQDDDYESALLEALIEGKLLGIFDGPGHQRLARARNERVMS
jgi:hypothetical protein